MKNLLTNLALCLAIPLTLDSVGNNFTKTIAESPTPSPDFSIIEPEHARTYIQKIYPYALKVEEEQSIPVAITLAIACLESGYGHSYYAKTRHNHLGIRMYKNGKAGYRNFPDLEACFEFYSNMFSLERYQPLQDISTNNLPAFIQGLQECGFNHRERYSKKLLQMIRFLRLEELVATV